MQTLAATVFACGNNHTLLIDQQGVVWSGGDNKYGQLGLFMKGEKYCFAPIPNLPVISQVFAPRDGEFSFLIDEEGNLWGCGLNDCGQLGLENAAHSSDVRVPTRIPFIPTIVMVSCGLKFSVLLDALGDIWESGINNWGERRNKDSSFHKMDTKNVGPIIKIDTNINHITVMNENYNLWKTEIVQNVVEFHEVKIWRDQKNSVEDFCCTHACTLVLDQNGCVWKDANRGVKVNCFKKILNIPAMAKIMRFQNSSLLIDNSGKAWTGEVNAFTKKCYKPIPCLPKIYCGDGGIAHSLLCDEDGKVWGCGNSSFGQLASEFSLSNFTKIGHRVNIKNRFIQTKRALQETN